jgi:hypothetical protein
MRISVARGPHTLLCNDPTTLPLSLALDTLRRGGWPQRASQVIAGATRAQYAPEPRDAGLVLECVLTPKVGEKMRAASAAPVRLGEGLFDYVNTLVGKGGGEFNVVIVQLNGAMQVRTRTSA